MLTKPNRSAPRTALVVAALLSALHPARVEAHGPAWMMALVPVLVVTPNVGAEYLSGRAEGSESHALLSWPIQFGLDESFFDNSDKSHHRLVASPEFVIGTKSEFRGRAGYRWVPKPFFFGVGVSDSNSLGWSAVPEVGYRFFDAGLNLYVTARADVALTSTAPARWASSLSVGLAFF